MVFHSQLGKVVGVVGLLLLVGQGCPTKPTADVMMKGEAEVKVEEGAMMEKKEPAMMKDGESAMMKDGAMMIKTEAGATMMMKSDVMMSDGTKVMMDGKVMMKDGSSVMMKDGDAMMMKDGKAMMQKGAMMDAKSGMMTGENRNMVFMMKDGKMMAGVENSGATMMEKDMMMSDGTKVMMDGKVMMKDGATVMMKEGETIMMKDGKAVMGVVAGSVSAMVGTQVGVGSYQPYDQAKLMTAKTGKVVLFFAADWCPTCQAADANFTSMKNKIPANLAILKVNYDTSAELKKKYGVTYQHTFVQVDANGNLITKWSNSRTVDEVVAKLK